MADSPRQTTSSQATETRSRGRDRLAAWVVIGSFLTLFLLIGNRVVSSTNTSETVFNTVLPVLAGWVGTVLAFYFSAASQEASLDKVIGQRSATTPLTSMVWEKMIALGTIAKLQNLDVTVPSKIYISDLQNLFKSKLPNGPTITRLIFIERGIFKYILHQAALNAFLTAHSPQAGGPQQGGPQQGEPQAVPPPNPEDAGVSEKTELTLSDLLADPDTLHQISKLVVFVSAGTTIGDAKLALDKVPGAQDIIVTATGNATDPMLGWLSNVDLIKAMTAN